MWWKCTYILCMIATMQTLLFIFLHTFYTMQTCCLEDEEEAWTCFFNLLQHKVLFSCCMCPWLTTLFALLWWFFSFCFVVCNCHGAQCFQFDLSPTPKQLWFCWKNLLVSSGDALKKTYGVNHDWKTMLVKWATWDSLQEHLHQWLLNMWPAKNNFGYLLFPNLTPKTQTTNKWETTNSNPPRRIKLSTQ